MPLTTTTTPAKIAVALGQSAPASGSPIEQQWALWISDALMLVQARTDSITPTPTVDQDVLDYVIREAVVALARRPDDATQVVTAVDDGSVSKTYRSGPGRISILDEWWVMLGLTTSAGKAFEVDTMPAGAGAGRYPQDYWWSSPTSWEISP